MFERFSDWKRPDDMALVEGVAIFHADCMEVLPALDAGSVDLVFADPPYNIGKDFRSGSVRRVGMEGYLDWCYEWLNEIFRILRPTGSFYLMAATQFMPHLDIFIQKHLHIISRIVWHYDSSGVQAKQHFGSNYEPILHAVKDVRLYTLNLDDVLVEAKTGAVRKLIDYRKEVPAPYSTRKNPGNVWYVPRVRYRMPEYENHPTQKPEALLERIVLASSNPGDLVLDPFAGTFTTCAVAKRLKRRTIGIDTEWEYYKIGLRRLGLASQVNGEILQKDRRKKTQTRTKSDHMAAGLNGQLPLPTGG